MNKFKNIIVPYTKEVLSHAVDYLGYKTAICVLNGKHQFLGLNEEGVLYPFNEYPVGIKNAKEYTVSDFLKLRYKLEEEITPEKFKGKMEDSFEKIKYLYEKGYSVYVTGTWIGDISEKAKVITIGG